MIKSRTPDDLKKLFKYEPNTGDLIWNTRYEGMVPNMPGGFIRQWNGKCAGKIVGTKSKQGYLTTRIFGVSCACHRIVWAIVYGEWPTGCIDHIDHDRTNNRIENLRVRSPRENSLNMSRAKSNTSGVTGVYWFKRAQKWMARIGNNNQRLNLGSYARFEDAVKARKDAERALRYHANHGILPAIRKAA